MVFEGDISQNILEKEIVYVHPYKQGFTLYTKSNCNFCAKVKRLFKSNNMTYKMIQCDKYIAYNKEDFFYFIRNITGRNIRTFPIIFYNGKFIDTYEFIVSNEMSSLIECFLDTSF